MQRTSIITFKILLFLTFFSFPSVKATPKISLPKVFSDKMILQRNMIIPVWGSAFPGEKITVNIGTQNVRTVVDKKGNWSANLKPMKAGGPFEMKISDAGGESIILKDILIGDVWICAGQSNMNFILSSAEFGKKELKNLNNQNLREFRCAMPEGALNPENKEHSRWIPASDTTANLFSAVAYYFAKKIQAAEKVPVGIIVMSCGATRAESWMSLSALKNYPKLKPLLNYWSDTAHVNKSPINFIPCVFYEKVVKPVVPFAVKGIVWYQGESNTLPDESGRTILSRADEYETLLRALIANWRKDWNNKNLPFNIVQLPSYKDPSGNIYWSVIRQAQLDISKKIKNVGLTVTIDVGDSTSLHPLKKEPVGNRIALWALAKVYGKKGIVFSGPVIERIHSFGNKVFLVFKNIGKRLVCKNFSFLKGFEISDNSSQDDFIPANAFINGDSVIVLAPGIERPYAVRYAWADNPYVSLFNSEGLPASPFCIKVAK